MAVITINNGEVVDCRALNGEEPFTEWRGGTVIVKYDEKHVLRAYQEDGEMLI